MVNGGFLPEREKATTTNTKMATGTLDKKKRNKN